ncbi:hypothetical protein BDQ17DRAFT_1541740 [Cyathus striatus]|nr:hypothetical protein BDQ17DRAFT_1541740 [Cyathus striatus]
MTVLAGTFPIPMNIDFIIAPHEICHSCANPSGPKFYLTNLRGPSAIHRNNSFPNESARELAVSHVTEIESELTQIDEEIVRLQRSLSTLQQRRDTLDRYRTQEQSLFAPIRKLPEDLLQHLFLTCQRTLEEDGYISVSKQSTFVRTITQVCAYWRFVAYHFPLLWTKLRISDCSFYTPVKKATTMAHFIEACVENLSSNAPLSIEFDGAVAGNCPSLLEHCIQAMARCSHRWENIVIENSRLMETLMDYIPTDTSFNSLRTLDLAEMNRSVSFFSAPNLTHFTVGKLRSPALRISLQNAPSLTNLSLHGTFHPLTTLVNFPWTQITHFICRINEDISLILQNMPNLISLELNGHIKITESATLPHLQSLKINSHMEHKNALEVWTAPCLQTLHLEQHFDFATTMLFVGRSRCPLLELTYTHHIPVVEGWKSEELWRVRNLSIRQPRCVVEDLRLLTRNGRHCYSGPIPFDPVLPQLEVLNLHYWDYSANVPIELISMLTSRLPPVGQEGIACLPAQQEFGREMRYLKSVNVLLSWELNNEDAGTLRNFLYSPVIQQPGVEVVIRHGYEGGIFPLE